MKYYIIVNARWCQMQSNMKQPHCQPCNCVKNVQLNKDQRKWSEKMSPIMGTHTKKYFPIRIPGKSVSFEYLKGLKS